MYNNILNRNPVYNEFQLNTDWIMSAMSNIWEPLLLGTVIIGIVSSIVGYILMHVLWKIYLYNRLKKRKV